MGKDVTCEIVLENQTGYFTNGAEVKGQLKYTLAKPLSPKGISIHLFCSEHNSWKEIKRIAGITYYTTYEGHYDIIHMNAFVYQSTNGLAPDVISAGSHVFDFAFKLPYELPSSFTGPYGLVRYRLEAKIHGFKKYDWTTYITVLSTINLAPLEYSYFEPTSLSNEKTTCCWCCAGGPISIEANLPKLAFILGEKIPISVRLTNNSNTNVKALHVKLEQIFKYIADRPSRQIRGESKDMLKFKKQGVEAKGQQSYDLELIVPKHLQTPNFSFCKLFEVNYQLKIIAEMRLFSLNLDITCFPKLGHVNVIGDVSQGVLLNPNDYYLPTTVDETLQPPPAGFSEDYFEKPAPQASPVGVHAPSTSKEPSTDIEKY